MTVWLFVETVPEEQGLELDGVQPVFPVVGTGSYIELMRNAFLHELFVQRAVDLIEEVLCAAVDDDVHCLRLEEICQVYHCVLLPVFRKFVLGSDTLRYAPFGRERPEVYSS